ncbi:hypothetical protein [Weissella thailandensis]|uniref:Uncharacterized protein n=1 Tax=Weissella thailandensis TaxID=89061 RepID=A0ABX9I7H0_9LACO|nr:hypothetical protein [Weissella thailandensis]NKY90117.1 hypothetical protein [Weissella thailandensis]RDS60195.1 hypothetical protein DWV05_01205 [Weissella thailandensis]GEP75038.1 hypothetical protein WTH01_12850 [Weissella thailandensis]
MQFFEPKITNLRLNGFANNPDDKTISIVGITNEENETQLKFNFHALYISPTGKYIFKMKIFNRNIEILNDEIIFEPNFNSNDEDKRLIDDYFGTGINLNAKQISFSEGPHKFVLKLCDLNGNKLDEKEIYFYVKLK